MIVAPLTWVWREQHIPRPKYVPTHRNGVATTKTQKQPKVLFGGVTHVMFVDSRPYEFRNYVAPSMNCARVVIKSAEAHPPATPIPITSRCVYIILFSLIKSLLFSGLANP